MANLLRTLTRRRGAADEISRYDISWYWEQLNNPWAIYGGYTTTNRFGRPSEPIENNFSGYVNAAYKSNGVIFSIILARMLLFTDVRFQFRQVRENNGRPGNLFGTDALSILERPWPNGTTRELLARMEQDVSLGGNAYLVNEGDRLRRLRPDWTSIILTAPPEEAVQSDVAGYMYTPGGTAEPTFYTTEEICHWSPIPDPIAQYRGMSWITPVVQEIQADAAATKHKAAFFKNGAKPGLVVSLHETVTDEQFRDFMKIMQESHGGEDNAYKTLYVGGGADVTVAGANLQQLDFKNTQGAGETRLCAAGGVPPVIVGLSEGLQAATYSNYSSARRKFGDGWGRPQWGSVCGALGSILTEPGGAELWYDDRDVAFLREDQADAANIQSTKASTISAYITAGFTPESAVSAVDADDRSLLVHSGLVSVQLQPPGAGVPVAPGQPTGETGDGSPAAVDAAVVTDPTTGATADDTSAARSAAPPTGHGNARQLHDYWTHGEGLAKWAESPEPWTTLHAHLAKFMDDEEAKRTAAQWFHDVFHFWPGADLNRVTHGEPPRGHRVGPG